MTTSVNTDDIDKHKQKYRTDYQLLNSFACLPIYFIYLLWDLLKEVLFTIVLNILSVYIRGYFAHSTNIINVKNCGDGLYSNIVSTPE